MRDQEQHPIDQLFARNLKSARVKAPESVWSGVASAMENRRLQRKVFIARITAAASLALLIGFGAWYVIAGQYRNSISQDLLVQQGVDSNQGGSLAKALVIIPGEETCDPYEQRPSSRSIITRALQQRTKTAQGVAGFKPWPKKNAQGIALQPVAFLSQPEADFDRFQRPLLDMPADWGQVDPAPALWGMNDPQQPAPLRVNQDFMEEFAHADEGDRKDEDESKSRFALGGTAAPDFAFASQTPVSLGKLNASSKNALPESAPDAQRTYTPVTALTSGLHVGYGLNDRFTLNTGVFYTNRRSNRDHAVLTNGEVEAVETNFDISFIEIPATIRYKVVDRRHWAYYVSTGVSANLFVHYDNYLETSSGDVAARRLSDKADALTPAQTNLLVSTGLQVKLNKHISLNFEPGMRYGIYTNDYAFSQSHPVSLAAFSGIDYNF